MDPAHKRVCTVVSDCTAGLWSGRSIDMLVAGVGGGNCRRNCVGTWSIGFGRHAELIPVAEIAI